MFNSLIHPRNPSKISSDALHILFCHEGIVNPGQSFQPNHFAPLVFYSSKHKRKCSSATTCSSVPSKKLKVAKKVDGDIFKFFQKEEKQAVVSVCTNTRAPNETFSSKAQLASIVTTDIPPANSKPELSDDQVKTTLPLPTRKYMHAETLALLTRPLYFPNTRYLKVVVMVTRYFF